MYQINTTAIQPSSVFLFQGLINNRIAYSKLFARKLANIGNFATMSKYLVQVLITLSLCAESSPTENIEIRRFIESPGDNWKSTKDSFYLPKSVCEQDDERFQQFCDSSICDEQEHHISCSCPTSNSTLIYRNNLWKCRGNIEVRTQLGRLEHFNIVTKNPIPLRLANTQLVASCQFDFLSHLASFELFPPDYKWCACEKAWWI